MNREEKKEQTFEKNAWKEMITKMDEKAAIVEQNPASESLLTIKNGQHATNEEDPTGALLF